MSILIGESSSFGIKFFWQSLENFPVKLFSWWDIAFRIRMTTLFSCSTNEWRFIIFFTKLSIFFFKNIAFPFYLFSLVLVERCECPLSKEKDEENMLYCFFLEVLHRVLALTSKSIPLTYISLICVIILLKQTAFQNSLTSFWGVFLGWILQVSSSYTCLQSLYNKVCDSLVHSIIMFPLDSLARMGLLPKAIAIFFIFPVVSLRCCFFTAVLLACCTKTLV